MIEIVGRLRAPAHVLVILGGVQHNRGSTSFYSQWRKLTTHNLFTKNL
jgi:hypothetical protein